MCRECRPDFDADRMAFADTAPECIDPHPTGGAIRYLITAIFLAACMLLAAL